MKKLLLLIAIGILFGCSADVKKKVNPKPQKTTIVQINDIKSALKDKNVTITESGTIKSTDYDLVYFTAAKLSNGDIGVWCSGGSTMNPGLWLSVNNDAFKNSVFPQNFKRADMTKNGAKEIYNYVDSLSRLNN